MLNPWVLLGVAVMWALSLLGVGKWQRADGRTTERVEWQAREVAQVTAANAAIKRLNDKARAKERASVDAMAVLAANYSKGFHDAEARRVRDVSAARDGALVLRIPAAALCPGGGQAGALGPDPGGGAGPETVELPRTVTADLLTLANDADQVADQLRTCQQIAINDRKE
jgi:hypothetical protein